MTLHKNTIFSLLAVSLLPSPLFSQQRSVTEILTIAQKHYQEIGWPESSTRAPESIEIVPSSRIIPRVADQEYFYLCNSRENGFVVVSADQQMPEVLGYSTNGYEAKRGLPPGLLYVMGGYARMSEKASVSRATQSVQASVGPLLKTAWDQSIPYNNMCPRDGISRSMTGCVATAAAQLMKYYEWPKAKASGVIEYATDTKNINVSIDLSDYGFAWNMMLDTYLEGKYTNAQASAVSKLMYAVGAVCKMDYTSMESGASLIECTKGMNQYFAYDNDLYLLLGSNVEDEQWNRLIVKELDEFRPVLMSGISSGDNAGHAFVLDGYETRGGDIYYHVNWGWSGAGDGYYLVNHMTPTSGGIGAGMGSYNDFQLIVLNCQPDDGKTTPVYGCIQSLELSKSAFQSGEEILFDATINNLCCMLSMEFAGSVFFEFIDENGTCVEQFDLEDIRITTEESLYGTIENLSCPPLSDGIYSFRMLLKKENGNKIELYSNNPWPTIRIGDVTENGLIELLQEKTSERIIDMMGIEKKNASNQKLPAGFYVIGDRKVIVK